MALLQPTKGTFRRSYKPPEPIGHAPKKTWEDYLMEALTGISVNVATTAFAEPIKHHFESKLQAEEQASMAKREMKLETKRHQDTMSQKRLEVEAQTERDRQARKKEHGAGMVAAIEANAKARDDYNRVLMSEEQISSSFARANQTGSQAQKDRIADEEWHSFTTTRLPGASAEVKAAVDIVRVSGSRGVRRLIDLKGAVAGAKATMGDKQRSAGQQMSFWAEYGKREGFSGPEQYSREKMVQIVERHASGNPIPLGKIGPRAEAILRKHGRRILPEDVARYYEREIAKADGAEVDEFGIPLRLIDQIRPGSAIRPPIDIERYRLGSEKFGKEFPKPALDHGDQSLLDGSKGDPGLVGRTTQRIARLATSGNVRPPNVTPGEMSDRVNTAETRVHSDAKTLMDAITSGLPPGSKLLAGGPVGLGASPAQMKEYMEKRGARTVSDVPVQRPSVEPHIEDALAVKLGIAKVDTLTRDVGGMSVPYAKAVIRPAGYARNMEQFMILNKVDPAVLVDQLEQAVVDGGGRIERDGSAEGYKGAVQARFRGEFIENQDYIMRLARAGKHEDARALYSQMMTKAIVKENMEHGIYVEAATAQTAWLLDEKEASKHAITIALSEAPTVPTMLATGAGYEEGTLGRLPVTHYKSEIIGKAIRQVEKEMGPPESGKVSWGGASLKTPEFISRLKESIVKRSPKLLPTSGLTNKGVVARNKGVIRTEFEILDGAELLMTNDPAMSFREAYGTSNANMMNEIRRKFLGAVPAKTTSMYTQKPTVHGEAAFQMYKETHDLAVSNARVPRIQRLLEHNDIFRKQALEIVKLANVPSPGIAGLTDQQGRPLVMPPSQLSVEVDKIMSGAVSGLGLKQKTTLMENMNNLLTQKFVGPGGGTAKSLSEHINNIGLRVDARDIWDANSKAIHMQALQDPLYSRRIYNYNENNPREQSDFVGMAVHESQATIHSAEAHLNALLLNWGGGNKRLKLDPKSLTVDAVRNFSTENYNRAFYRGKTTNGVWNAFLPLQPAF